MEGIIFGRCKYISANVIYIWQLLLKVVKHRFVEQNEVYKSWNRIFWNSATAHGFCSVLIIVQTSETKIIALINYGLQMWIIN